MARVLGIIVLVLLFLAPIATYTSIHTSDARDGKVHLSYMAWGSPEQQATDIAVLRKFEARNPNIKVDFIVAPGNDYPPKVQIMMAADIAPDVFKFDLFYLPKYFPHDFFMPLDQFDEQDDTFSFNDFHPATKGELQYNGKILGLNTLFGGRILYYNKKLFKEAGLPDPYEQFQRGEWTFEAFAKTAKALTKLDHDGIQVQLGARFDIMDMWWLIWGFGGEIIDKNHNIYINEPEAIEAIRFYAQLLKDKAVMWGARDSSKFLLERGQLGIYFESQGASPRLRRQINDSSKTLTEKQKTEPNAFDWDICPVPTGRAGPISLMKGNGLIMSSRTKHPKEAWELLKFLNSPETEMEYCGPALRRAIPTRIVQDNAPPERIDMAKYLSPKRNDDDKNPPPPYNTKTFLNILDKARQLPVTDKWQNWQPDFAYWFDKLNREAVTPEEFAAGLEKDLRKTLGPPTGPKLFTPGATKPTGGGK